MIFRIPLLKIDIPGGGMHLACRLYGHSAACYVLIDTGASVSVFDDELMTEHITGKTEVDDDGLASGVNAPIENQTFGKLSGVAVETLPLYEQKVGLMDLSHLRELYTEYFDISICGLIGSDFLEKYEAEILYKYGILRLHKL